jgi:hydroxyethylthiazole kinase-like uncharacterized protein yjeF
VILHEKPRYQQLGQGGMSQTEPRKPEPLYSTAEIREIEQRVAAFADQSPLMERAGLAVAEIARDKLLTGGKTSVLVLAGPGNNGGDAFVAAHHLRKWRYEVTLVFAGERERQPEDAQRAQQVWVEGNGEMLSGIPVGMAWDVVIDGLFGIGLDQRDGRELTNKYLTLVNTINAMKLPVLSVDIPSGLGSDTGSVCGAAINATITVTFIGLKPGLFTNDGPDYCGEVLLHDLGLNAPSLIEARSWLIDQNYIQQLLPAPRRANSHKGMFGNLGIIGGAPGMIGAALLAGSAALKLGA